MISVYEFETESEKVIRIYKNGESNSKQHTKITLKQGIRFQDIQNKVSKELNIKPIQNFRLFNREGVEIFETDLQFLRNNYILLASGGEDYDSSTGFAEFEILRVIGEGGFGKVILGEHKITSEKVAIKFVNTSLIGNASDIDMVFHEAEVLKNLQHINIVKIFNCYTLKGMEVVFIMEYLQGGELLEYVMKKGRLSEVESRLFFRQIVEAIQYCHKQNVIHRDLKLENILLSQSGSSMIKIIDFGIAKVGSMNTSKLNVGSLRYMAPEVLSNTITFITKGIDIWSLGVILYTLVCGNLPFNGESPQEIVKTILVGEFSFPPLLDGYLTPEIKELINLILVKDPVTRYTMKQIKAHPWMTLPTIYLQKAEELYQEKQAQLNAQKDRGKNSRGRAYGLANMREPTGSRTMMFGGNRMREPTGMNSGNSMSRLREPTATTKMRETTGMSTIQPSLMRDQTSMRESTRTGGMNQLRGGPTATVTMLKRQSKPVMHSKPAPPQGNLTQSAAKRLADFQREVLLKNNEHIKSSDFDDHMSQIKAVLGYSDQPEIPASRDSFSNGAGQDSILEPQQAQSDAPPTAARPSVVNNGSSLVVPSPLASSMREATTGKDLPKVKVVKMTNIGESSNPIKEMSASQSLGQLKPGISPTSSPISATRSHKSFLKPPVRNSVIPSVDSLDAAGSVSRGSAMPMDSSLKDVSSGAIAAAANDENGGGYNPNQYQDRLVYILRRRRLVAEQGDPELQINKDYLGIYKPQKIGYIQFTSGINIRDSELIPARQIQNLKMKSLSPLRKRQVSPPNQQEPVVLAPKNAIEANAFLARNTYTLKIHPNPNNQSPSPTHCK